MRLDKHFKFVRTEKGKKMHITHMHSRYPFCRMEVYNVVFPHDVPENKICKNCFQVYKYYLSAIEAGRGDLS